MRIAASLVALFIAAASPLVAATDPFARALAALRASDPSDPYCDDDDRAPSEVVCRALQHDASADAAAAAIARELGVSGATARGIGVAGIAIARDRWNGTKPDAAELPAITRSLRAALRREPRHEPILVMLAQLAQLSADDTAFDTALLPLIHAEPHPAELAIAMAEAPTRFQQTSVAVFLGDALARDPRNETLLAAAGDTAQDAVTQAALGPLDFTAPAATLRPHTGTDDAKLAERLVHQFEALDRLALPEAIVTGYEALPPALARRVDAAPKIRAGLAAAAVLAGKPELARAIVQDVAAPAAAPDGEAGTLALLRTALDLPGKKAFFDAAVEAFQDGGPLRGVRARLFAMLADRNGHPDFAAQLLRRLDAGQEPELAFAPPQLAAWLQPVERRVRATLAADATRIAAVAPDTSPAASTSRASLALPRLAPFVERSLASFVERPLASFVEQPLASFRGASGEQPVTIDCSDAARVAETTNLPPFIAPIRMERNGNDVVAVAISSAVDPAGEVGLGGYWIVRSRDGGNSWSEYYTGLRENMPYVVSRTSTLPMIAGDRLRIEVEVQELDPRSITFPPTGLRLARSQKGLVLDFDEAALTRDRDGDGLTDLLEERITTDASNPDTDGDGIADGEDTLPQVAFGGRPDATAEVIGAVFHAYVLGGGRVVEGIGSEAATAANACALRASLIGEPVLFLDADRALFAPLTMSRHTIVLSNEELDQYTKKFGPTYAAMIEYVLIDGDGRRAIVKINQSWTGETLLLTRTPGGWTSVPITWWIS